MTETPPRHATNYSDMALPYRPPRNPGGIGSGYMYRDTPQGMKSSTMDIGAITNLLNRA
jgi:hypothetical protein